VSVIHPDNLSEIASILARGYLRYRESLKTQPENCLDSEAQPRPHLPAVNALENRGEAKPAQEVRN
jgi:hypothetical protein